MHSVKKQPNNTEREAEKMARRNSYSFALVPMDWAVNPPAKSALQVWIILHDHRDQTGHSYVSHSEIMEISGLSRSALKKAISWLVDGAYITATAGGQKGGTGRDKTRYRFRWHTEVRPEKYHQKINAQGGHFSNPQQGTKDSGRGSESKTPYLLINKTSSEEDVIKHTGGSEIEILMDLFVSTAQAASEWARELPGVHPPTPRAITPAWASEVKALWKACKRDQEQLLEYFKKCYARPWHRGLTEGEKQWFVESFTWFLDKQKKLLQIDWDSEELANDCRVIDQKLGRSAYVL